MKIATVLSLRSLASKIHQPLPLSPRDSQKLLSILKASFRQQLDREHPVAASGHAHDAHHHLHSILTNPLFIVKTRRSRLSSKDRAAGVHESLKDAQLFVQRPMGYFKERVAAGTATVDIARLCLHAQYKTAVASSDAKATNALKSSAAGSTVLSWLWSSGLEGSNTFLLEHTFVAAIMPFLVAEGHQAVAWRWLRRLQIALDGRTAVAASDEPLLRRSKANVLLQLVKSEVNYGGGFNAAMECFLCCTGVEPFPGPVPTDSRAQLHMCWRAGSFLVHALVHRSAGIVPDVGLYNDFVRSVRTWTLSNPIFTALLLLHHPVSPNWAPALHHLRCLSPKMLSEASPRRRRSIVQLCLDSAGLLLSHGRQVDATWVMELAQNMFPEQFGSAQSSETTGSSVSPEETSARSDESSNLELLEALAAH